MRAEDSAAHVVGGLKGWHVRQTPAICGSTPAPALEAVSPAYEHVDICMALVRGWGDAHAVAWGQDPQGGRSCAGAAAG